MRISDWSSDVCSSDLTVLVIREPVRTGARITPPQEARVQAFIDRHPSWPAPLRLVCANVVGAVLCPLKIGRASCRERVCQLRVDIGGRRIIQTKKKYNI